MKPKKHLGQNFLQDVNIAREIADALDLRAGETVVEIGPGHGELTRELGIGNKELRILAIEKDERLADWLNSELVKWKLNGGNIRIVRGDALKELPKVVSQLTNRPIRYKLVGNIPYYITGHLLRILSELNPKPEKIVLMVQKEVAERLCAAPPGMNLLAASVQFWSKPAIIAEINRKNFHPAPKVDSAIIEIVPLPKGPMKPDVFYPFIAALFKQPRKTILNNLYAGVDYGHAKTGETANKEVLAKKIGGLGIDPATRPQDLSLADIVSLARRLK